MSSFQTVVTALAVAVFAMVLSSAPVSAGHVQREGSVSINDSTVIQVDHWSRMRSPESIALVSDEVSVDSTVAMVAHWDQLRNTESTALVSNAEHVDSTVIQVEHWNRKRCTDSIAGLSDEAGEAALSLAMANVCAGDRMLN